MPVEGYQAYPGVNLLEERDRQRHRLGGELRELDRRIEASVGYRLRAKMSLLQRSYFVFDVNHLNLRHVLDEFEQPTVFLKLWEEHSPDRLDLFINDVIRLFHNYLAGAESLLDHVGALRGELYRGTDAPEEYPTRWDQHFGGSSLPRFVKDLRLHMLCEGLPLVLAQLSFGGAGSRQEISSAVELDANKLGTWERWSAEGRGYLDTLDGKVGLDEIVDRHAALVADFYRWFAARQSELHREAFEELEELEGERERLRQEIGRLEDTLETAEKTALSIREERERLAGELEAERRYRAWDKERADRFEQDLERERSKGFWRRVFGR